MTATSRWRRRVRKLGRRLFPPRPGAVILGYHRIADPHEMPGGDPYRLCVSPAAFGEQMRILREVGRPVTLAGLFDALERGEPVRGMVAVTFDDGCREVATAALPELERYEVPATVLFIAGNAGQPFWWDRLAAMLADVDPGIPLRVIAGNTEFTWSGVGGIEALGVELHRMLRVLSRAEREKSLSRLAEVWRQVEPPLPRALTMNEARPLVDSEWIEAGAHSVDHPPLAEIPPRRAQEEIFGSRERLESALDREIRAFSYPHGSRNETTDRLVRAAGYAFACTSHQDSVRAGVDPFRLPRVWPTDRAGGAFRRRLLRFLGTRRPRWS